MRRPVRFDVAGRRFSIGDVGLGVSVAVGALGLAAVAFADWREGVGLLGGATLFAALARIVLPDRMAGLLRVRRKTVDVVSLVLLGTALLVLSVVVPNRA